MLSDQRNKLHDEFEKEVAALEAKFQEKKRPILEQRKAIVDGSVSDFTALLPIFNETQNKLETIVAGISKSTEQKKEDDEHDERHKPTEVAHLKDVVGVPDFWFLAFKNNPMLSQEIFEKDLEVLKHLRDVSAERTEEPKCITINMVFHDNEFFSNNELKLKVSFRSSQEVDEIDGTIINWKDGKDITKKKIKKKQKHKKTNETRTIIKTVPADSFFNLFESKKAPESIEEDDQDSETERLLDGLDKAMQAAEDIHDLYFNEALEFYLGFGDTMDMLGGDVMGSGSEGEGDDSDEDKPKPKKVKAGKDAGAGAGTEAAGAGAAGQQQECKQQ